MMSGTTEQQRASSVRGSRSLARALISAMRPLQAPKNGLVLVPLIFSVNIWFAVDDLGGMAEIVLRAVGATVAFTLLSGAVYLINDLADVERDRVHPVKRRRAIASGDLPVGVARISAVIAIVAAGLISVAISAPLLIVALAYLLLNVVYTFKLKHVAILDVMSVAAGFIDALIMSTATLAIFTYALYAIDLGDTGANVPADNTMMVTIPFVAYGIYRYLYLLYVGGEGEAPEIVLLRDRPTLINGFLWLAVASTILLVHTIGTANGG